MPQFGKTSKERLETCHPVLWSLCSNIVRDYDITVLADGGWRSPEKQLQLYDLGRTKVMKSKHNHMHDGRPWSLAVDIAPYPVDFGKTPKEVLRTYTDTRMTAETIALLERKFIKASHAISRFYYLAGLVRCQAQMMGLRWGTDIRWGGDWDSDNDFFDQTFFDLAHFELIGFEDRPYWP